MGPTASFDEGKDTMYTRDHRKDVSAVVARHTATVAAASLLALAAAFWAGSAKAAPQALALVSTNGPIELVCEDGKCSIDLTAFCLQKDRPAPEDGTTYEVAFGELRMEGVNADGSRVSLDPRQVIDFTSLRSYTAVRVALRDGVEGADRLAAINMYVPENVALVPVVGAGDPTPHSEDEIAMIGQSLRPFGSRILDSDPDSVGAARVINRVLNRLPKKGWAEPAVRSKAWEDAAGSGDGKAASPEGLHRAKRSFELCEWGEQSSSWTSMRRCLEMEHDQLIQEKNSEYWKGMDVGI